MLNEVNSFSDADRRPEATSYAGPGSPPSPVGSTQTAVSPAPAASPSLEAGSPKLEVGRLAEILAGRRTYIVAGLALAYLAGCKLGWWAFDGQILAAFGFTAAATLRAAVAKVLSALLNPPPRS